MISAPIRRLISESPPLLVNDYEVLISRLDNLGINNEHGRHLGRRVFAVVLADGVVTSRHLHEMLTHAIDLRCVSVHATQNVTFSHGRDDGGTRVLVRRGPAVRWESYLDCNEGLAGCVLELIFVEDLDVLSWAGAAEEEIDPLSNKNGLWGR